MADMQRHMHHRPCDRCGHGLAYHERERVYPADGPPGSWHYRYLWCPTGKGVYRRG